MLKIQMYDVLPEAKAKKAIWKGIIFLLGENPFLEYQLKCQTRKGLELEQHSSGCKN